MLKILTGIVSGIVSGTGMGGGTILILILSVFMRDRPTRGTSYKFGLFCTNLNNGNNSINKRKTYRMENRNNISNIWSYGCNNWSKNIGKNGCRNTKENVWYIFKCNCNKRNIFFNKRV